MTDAETAWSAQRFIATGVTGILATGVTGILAAVAVMLAGGFATIRRLTV
ncbi:hypothetical protein [Nonomuraea jabiensis]|uniref:Uncharacterized protein n=1 Tax=Nonomuraea jabiensis TaxID=882448 RepID=A0A7W9LIM9_9ACTN|nr:hypothetical protein [Nonomuraea jabiensis]MBB5785200.1 hypothetical protein [Nonomuraea jabiensis]